MAIAEYSSQAGSVRKARDFFLFSGGLRWVDNPACVRQSGLARESQARIHLIKTFPMQRQDSVFPLAAAIGTKNMGTLLKYFSAQKSQEKSGPNSFVDAIANALLLLVFAAELAVLYSSAFKIFMKFH